MTDDVLKAWASEAAIPPAFAMAILKVVARAAEAERERDLAVAHDRQPYPTAWAYEQVCRVREEQRARVERAERQAEALAKALERVTNGMGRGGGDRNGVPECPWCHAGPEGPLHAADCELTSARATLAAYQEGR